MKGIIKEAWQNFWSHKQAFINIALRMIIFSAILFGPSYYITTIQVSLENFGLISVLSMFLSVASLVMSYFNIKWTVAMIYLHQYISQGKEVSVKQALSDARQSVWRFIGGNIIIGLIAIIPGIILSVLIMRSGIDEVYRTTIISICVMGLMLFINGWVGFLPYIKAFQPGTDGAFSKARQMSEGCYWFVFMILNFAMLFSFITVVLNVIVGQVMDGLGFMIAQELITAVIRLIITPLTVGVAALGFFKMSQTTQKQLEA